MTPDRRLAIERSGVEFPTQVGLGCTLDPHLLATPALAEFGFGFLEIGPIRAQPVAVSGAVKNDIVKETIIVESPQESLTALAAGQRLKQDGPFRLPLFARIEPTTPREAREMFDELCPVVDGFVVSVNQLDLIREACKNPDNTANQQLMLFAAIDTDSWRDESFQDNCRLAIDDGMITGMIVVPVARDDGSQQFGKAGLVAALETVRLIRDSVGPNVVVIGSVGVHSPADALDYLDSGADLVQVDSGLVFAGPGLPKRINEAILYRRLMTDTKPDPSPTRIASESWFWAWLMGLSMLIGGTMAMIVATTRVVLPYDELMSGLSRRELLEINERLLSFMTHDRVTLSGTMLAVGIVYMSLAWYGIRRGVHWAYVSVVASAFAGFFTFFSFLGFGYFDPFHAFVTAILFQFLLFTMHANLPTRQRIEAPDLWNDGRWKANQWGQLLFVIHGAVLITAGIVISCVGMTSVLVHEDLEFMHTTAADLQDAHPQLVPLVAHDRATFGGMLLACGVATLLPALWGFRRGQAWLWWAFMVAGNIAYLSTITVHWTVGYDSLKHLLPAYGGLAWLWAGGIASYSFLAAGDPALDDEWHERVTTT